MNLSQQIRSLLASLHFPGMEDCIYPLMIHALLKPDSPPPYKVYDRQAQIPEEKRWPRDLFVEAASLRTFPRFAWGEPARRYLLRRFLSTKDHAERAVDIGIQPVHALWYAWILILGERHLGVPAERHLLNRLWFRGFYEQTAAGHIHRLTLDSLLEGFVYDELTALHAAYHIAKFLRDAQKLTQVQHAVRWHVQNTQPDNTTTDPWALAAFAALDDTGTFAGQQLHNTITHLAHAPANTPETPPPLAIGLLADAVFTLEDPLV